MVLSQPLSVQSKISKPDHYGNTYILKFIVAPFTPPNYRTNLDAHKQTDG